MDIDARLDRLTERHEALAQSLEILVATVSSNATQIRELGTGIRELGTVAGILLQVVQSHQDALGDWKGSNDTMEELRWSNDVRQTSDGRYRAPRRGYL